jgi:glycosyltransferase involved in cell wall biosynthesis
MKETIEFFILTMNEEKNIKDCISSIKSCGDYPITVLDGGSIDKTTEIAYDGDVKVVILPNSSISSRRGHALEISKTSFICFLDADQRLSVSLKPLENLFLHFASDSRLVGIQLRLSANPQSIGYWAKGFGARLKLITGTVGERKVIGTPCIFRTMPAKDVGYCSDVTGPSDDTFFCQRLIERGYTLRAVSEEASEVVRANLKGTVRKAFWYGCGDAEFISKARSGRLNHLFHIFIRGPIIYPLKIILVNPILIPFFLIFGLSRALGFVFGYIFRKDLTMTSS